MLGLVHIKANSAVNQFILIFGSSYILFDGGASLRLKVLKEVWITILVISTVGVLITAAITGLAAYYILGVPLIVAFLLGASLASTDPATLVPIFKQVPIKDRVAQTVMSESAFNDAMGAIVTFTVLAVAMGTGEFSLATAAGDLLKQAGIGTVIGGIAGYAAAFVIGHEKYDFLLEYSPLVTLMAVVGAYMTADLHASERFHGGLCLRHHHRQQGFLRLQHGRRGTETAGRVCHDDGIDHAPVHLHPARRPGRFRVDEQVPGRRHRGYRRSDAGRPPDHRVDLRRPRPPYQVVVEGTGVHVVDRETGVIPAALAGLLVGMNAPGAEMIASVTFIAVLMTILIQAPTTAWLARKLGLLLD
jgi:cell volume regulation protein A